MRERARRLTPAALCGYVQRRSSTTKRPDRQECRSLPASVLRRAPVGELAADFGGIGVFDFLEDL